MNIPMHGRQLMHVVNDATQWKTIDAVINVMAFQD